mmetsp:Transcript_5169/g.19233  ORF Transcript_5169/g.19233 Transcript_5169/m.19233 type:complete len:206 (-) Transcript_5169:56-673(-)
MRRVKVASCSSTTAFSASAGPQRSNLAAWSSAVTSTKQALHRRCGSSVPQPYSAGRNSQWLAHLAQKILPHALQWCLREKRMKRVSHTPHADTEPSGTHSAFLLLVSTASTAARSGSARPASCACACACSSCSSTPICRASMRLRASALCPCASKAAVASLPACLSSTAAPPGCSFAKAVASSTASPTTSHRSSSVQCAATSAIE